MAPPTARPAARPASGKGGNSGTPQAKSGAHKSSSSQAKLANGKGSDKAKTGSKGSSSKSEKAEPSKEKGGKSMPAAKATGKTDTKSKGGDTSSNKAKGSKPEVKQSAKSSPKAPESKASAKSPAKAVAPVSKPAAKSVPAERASKAALPSPARSSAAVVSPVKPAAKKPGKRKAEKAPPPRKMHQPVVSTGPTLVKSPPPSAISRPGPSTIVGRPASMMPPPAPVPSARAANALLNTKPNAPPPPQQNRPPRLSPFAVTAPIMPVQTKPLKLKMGDKAVHPKHGLGEVIAVEERELGGMKGEFYVLRILDNGMRVMVPVSSPSGLRSVMSPKEADGVLDTMRAREVAVDLQPWSRRFRAYTEMIKSGSPHEVAKVLRDMYRLKFDKDLSFGERRLLDQAKSLLMKELAAAKGVTEVVLNEQVAKMFQA
jgi:CarD family transcriptional regulator